MRPGLLAVGLILLVLGAIFYFVPNGAASQTVTTSDDDVDVVGIDRQTTTDTTQSGSVDTTVYAPGDTVTTTETTDTTSGSGGASVIGSGDADMTETTTVADRETSFFAVGDDDDTTVTSSTTSGAAGGDLQRQLSVLAMILGAILTILGLVLPDPEPVSNVQVNTTARTAGAAGRRVTYEREEEIDRRRY